MWFPCVSLSSTVVPQFSLFCRGCWTSLTLLLAWSIPGIWHSDCNLLPLPHPLQACSQASRNVLTSILWFLIFFEMGSCSVVLSSLELTLWPPGDPLAQPPCPWIWTYFALGVSSLLWASVLSPDKSPTQTSPPKMDPLSENMHVKMRLPHHIHSVLVHRVHLPPSSVGILVPASHFSMAHFP